jgi:hypothetical protein
MSVLFNACGVGDIPGAFHAGFAVRQLRAEFQAQPPALQAETLRRAQRLVAERPKSYLARHWQQIYVPREKSDERSLY